MIHSKEIEDYCIRQSHPVDPIFLELDEETKKLAPKAAHMQVGPLEGGFLSVLTKITHSKRILEFGTFTGCSSLHFAFSIPADGRVTTLDRDPTAVALAKRFWIKAKMDHKIESLLGDARILASTLEAEIQNGKRPKYDLAFIDADKGSYEVYFEAALNCVKAGGAILVDNLLWGGRVLAPESPSDQTLHQFNERYRNDPRVQGVLLPVRDGLSLFWVKP